MKSENISIRLRKLLEMKDLKQTDVLKLAEPYCKKYNIKLNKSDLSQFVNGKNEPGQWKLTILAMTLDVSEAWLMGYDVPMERESGKKPRFNSIEQIENAIPYDKGKNVPIFGTVRAGVGGAAYQEILGYEPVDATYNNTDDLFWLMVQGDSMTPELNNGDMVLVRKQTSVDSGDLAVVIVDKEEALVKRVYYDTDLIELHSKNPYYPVRRFVGDDVLNVCVVGLVLESKRKYVKI